MPSSKEKSNARNRKYYSTTLKMKKEDNPVLYLWTLAKKRSKEIELTIQPEDIIFTGYCPVTGNKLTVGGPYDSAMSLDRVDNTKGYVPGNVVAISRKANKQKNDLSIADIEAILKYMREYTQ